MDSINVDLERLRMKNQKLGNHAIEYLNVKENMLKWNEVLSVYARNGVHQEDQEKVLTVLKLDYLNEHLENSCCIERCYRNDLGIYGEMKLIRISDDSILGFAKVMEQENMERNGLTMEPLDKLRVRCFGILEVFWQGVPVIFQRKRTKELFAYLIDREGAACTDSEIIAALWEDSSGLNKTAYLRQLIYDLRNTLSAIGRRMRLSGSTGRWGQGFGSAPFFHCLRAGFLLHSICIFVPSRRLRFSGIVPIQV